MKKISVIVLLVLVTFSSFTAIKKQKPKLPSEFAWIPAGSYAIDSIMITTGGFYISKFEVTNLQYRQFLSETGSVFYCDSLGWNTVTSYASPMVNYYFRNKAYDSYPVVNISQDGAYAYCKWLQQKIQNDNPGLEILITLPSKFEWMYAAQGGRSQAMFPWANYYLKNKKGEPMCNYRQILDFEVYRNRTTGKPEIAELNGPERAIFTAPVKSFTPNDYGLYNICGNVAEMVRENGIAMGGSWNDYGADVQIRAYTLYDKASPTIGFRPMIFIKEKAKSY